MIIEYIIICIIGTILHFTYDLSNHNKIVGLFSSVNESTWEHIKIALTSYFICSFIDGFILSTNKNYFQAKFLGLLTIIIVMPLIYYSYKHFTKKSIIIIDILSFYITLAFSIIVFKTIINIKPLPHLTSYISIIGIFIIFGLYMILTILPIKNFLFKDPITNKYGFKAHR